MKIYKVNINGDFKVKREIDMNNYILWECLGSSGLTLKHKKILNRNLMNVMFLHRRI